jgi:hypothetical protein
MPYTSRFAATDALITHLSTVIPHITDPQLKANYAGFLSVSAVTVFELAVKDIFIDFSEKKHKAFGVFTASHFHRINGRIKLVNLRDEHVISFGEKYLIKFKAYLDLEEETVMRASRVSVKSAYSNLIVCRHNYVHEGSPTLSFAEIQSFYALGKRVLDCLDRAMKR